MSYVRYTRHTSPTPPHYLATRLLLLDCCTRRFRPYTVPIQWPDGSARPPNCPPRLLCIVPASTAPPGVSRRLSVEQMLGTPSAVPPSPVPASPVARASSALAGVDSPQPQPAVAPNAMGSMLPVVATGTEPKPAFIDLKGAECGEYYRVLRGRGFTTTGYIGLDRLKFEFRWIEAELQFQRIEPIYFVAVLTDQRDLTSRLLCSANSNRTNCQKCQPTSPR